MFSSVLGKLWRRPTNTVLIVSDNSPDPALNSAFLRQPEIRLLNSPPGQQALDLARRKQPSLIIESLQAPDQPALEFCRKLRADPGTRSIPLILVTEPELHEHAQRAQADAVLLKPLKRNEFFKAVRRFVPLPKRRHVRYGANLRFCFSSGSHSGQAFSRDLSLNGAFLKTDMSVHAGTRLDLRFRLPGTADEIRCRAAVVRATSTHEAHAGQMRGFAIEFDEMAEADMERLAQFITLSLGLPDVQ
jgi:CheY-like chemotaxis protein